MEAKRLVEKFEFIYTPKHGSWLNMAEIELHVLNSQCLSRHIATMEDMKKHGKKTEITKILKLIGNSKPKMHVSN